MIKMLIVSNGSDASAAEIRRHEYLTAITYGLVIKARGSQARYLYLTIYIEKTFSLTVD